MRIAALPVIALTIVACSKVEAPVARDAVEQAIAEAEASAVHGPALTPWLLARVAVLTEGASVRANTALIVNDARVAGQIAARLP